MPTRRKYKRRKKRTRKGGHATKCETAKKIRMYQAVSRAFEDERNTACSLENNPVLPARQNKPALPTGLKKQLAIEAAKRSPEAKAKRQERKKDEVFEGEGMGDLFYDGTCSDRSDCQKHEPFCHAGRCLNQEAYSAAKKKEGMKVATKRSKDKVMRELEGGPSLVGAFDDKQRAKKNWGNAAKKVKMANLVQKQLKEHPEHESSKGPDGNWHGWVARLDERANSPNKGDTYYYKDGHKTTLDAPKKDWVKVHEPQGGFYYWCTGNDKTTRTFPNKGTCLPPRPTSQAPDPPQTPINCGKYSKFDCNTVKGCEMESFEAFKARKKVGKKAGKNTKKMKKKCVSSTRKGGKKRRRKKTKKRKSKKKRRTKRK